MTDIAERLSNLIECEMDKAQCELYTTAKTEIAQLRAEIGRLKADATRDDEQMVRDSREIERLTEAQMRKDAEAREQIQGKDAEIKRLQAENAEQKAEMQKLYDNWVRVLKLPEEPKP